MKAFIRIVLLGLVLMTVALVSALTAMHFAIHGREVVVPNLVGMTPVEAERASLADGLLIEVQREYYSPNIAEGKIMSQLPLPGTKVRRGFQIRVARSLGPQRVAIPDVTHQTPRAAQLNIERRGLDLGTTAILAASINPADQVVAQSPPPNASGVSAPRISLLVSAPAPPAAFLMPNFVGQPLGTATTLLQAGGMRLGRVNVASSEPSAPASQALATVPASSPTVTTQPVATPSASSLVLSQNPPAGQKIILGATVDFEVSR